MVNTWRLATVGYRKVDARILEHPFGVVVLQHRGRAKDCRVEAHALRQILDCDMNVKAFHEKSPWLSLRALTISVELSGRSRVNSRVAWIAGTTDPRAMCT